MTLDPGSPEPPTVIVPTKRCWRWWARRPHRPHTRGEVVPNVSRCPGRGAPAAQRVEQVTQIPAEPLDAPNEDYDPKPPTA